MVFGQGLDTVDEVACARQRGAEVFKEGRVVAAMRRRAWRGPGPISEYSSGIRDCLCRWPVAIVEEETEGVPRCDLEVAASQVGIGSADMGVVPEIKKLFDVGVRGALVANPASGKIMAKVGPGFGGSRHVVATAQANRMGSTPLLRPNFDFVIGIEYIGDCVVI
jgi:hypothetical protein